MNSFDLNDEEFSNFSDKTNNINFQILDAFKGKNNENNDQNHSRAFDIRSNFLKENKEFNPTIIVQETKKFICDSINFNLGKAEKGKKVFLNKKRKRFKIYHDNDDNIKEQKKNKKGKGTKEKNNEAKRGRRRKDVEYDTKASHDKFKEDNVIQKIKTTIFKYILELLNKSLKNDRYEFYPLTKQICHNLTKEFNIKLLDRTIYDIYLNSELNKKYAQIPDLNKTLIKKIYNENTETDVKNLLEKKFRDILNYIREKDLDYFLNKIGDKERKNNKQFNEKYMNAVKNMLFQYEFYFKSKLYRNRRKNKTINCFRTRGFL